MGCERVCYEMVYYGRGEYDERGCVVQGGLYDEYAVSRGRVYKVDMKMFCMKPGYKGGGGGVMYLHEGEVGRQLVQRGHGVARRQGRQCVTHLS